MAFTTSHITLERATSIAPYYGYREVGLEACQITALMQTEVSEICEQLEINEKELNELGKLLTEELFYLIRQEKDTVKSNQLLGLKRSIHNRRWFDEEEMSDLLSDQLMEDLKQWQEVQTSVDQLKLRGELATTDYVKRASVQLFSLFEQEKVQMGICFAQPNLYKEIVLAKKKTAFNKRDRRAIITGAAYAYRMGTKTSPFSYFTALGFRCFDENKEISTQPDEVQELYVLNNRLLNQLKHLLISKTEYSDQLALILNPSMVITDENCFLVHHQSTSDTTVVQSEFVSVFPSNPLFLIMETIYNQFNKALTEEELMQCLKKTIQEEHKLRRYIQKLKDLKVLIPIIDFEENNLSALQTFIKSSAAKLLPKNVNEKLASIQECLLGLEQLNVGDKWNFLGTLTQLSNEISDALKLSEKPFIRQKIVHHTVYLKHTPELDASLPQKHLSGVEELLPVFTLFNDDFPLLKWMNSKAKEYCSFVTGVPTIIEFFHFVMSSEKAEMNPLLSPNCITNLEWFKLQKKVQQEFIEEIYTACLQSEEEIILDNAFCERWGERTQAFQNLPLPISATILGQFIKEEGEDVFLMNKIFSGYGTLSTNGPIRKDQKTPSSHFNDYLASTFPDFEFVDIEANLGFQGQIRPVVGSKKLWYPGQQQQCINWHQWKNIRLDFSSSGTPILLNSTSGKRIVPLHRGTLSNVFFPPFYRFLTLFGHGFSPAISLQEQLLAHAEYKGHHNKLQFPRIRCNSALIMRKSCAIPILEIPEQKKKESDFEYYRRMRLWSKEWSIPKETYVTPMQTSHFFKHEINSSTFKRSRKPFYLNWDDYMSFRLFLRYIIRDQEGKINFVEALPSIEKTAKSASKIAEYQFELYQCDE